MENMAEEELLPQEKVEVVQVPVPTPTPDSARVPAPAPDSAPVSASTPAPASAPTPASAPVPAPALAQASALSPSLASAPDEAESSKCREAQIFLPQEKQESAPCWGVGEALLHWNGFYGGKGSFSEMGGGTRDPYSGKNGYRVGDGISTNLGDLTGNDLWRPVVLQVEGNNGIVDVFFKGGLFLVQKLEVTPHLVVSLSALSAIFPCVL